MSQNKTVTFQGELHPQKIYKDIQNPRQIIDNFDFNPEQDNNDRGDIAEAVTRIIHYGATPMSTAYEIRAKKGSFSKVKQTYPFSAFQYPK